MAGRTPEARREYMRRWRKTLRERGLCLYCAEAATTGRVYCERHLAAVNSYKRGRWAELGMK